MKAITIVFVLIFSTTLTFAQQTINASITHDGLQRDYILYVPVSYSPAEAAPLVLNFHGYTSNALEQMFYGDFRPIADTAGFLIVHPQGTVDLIGNPHWNVGWGTSTVDDVGFTAALIDSLSDGYNIDQQRIYSTGMSNGGFMSYLLACTLSGRIAAIASVTGSMNSNQMASCDPEHYMPVMEIHGTADPTVPYAGTVFFEPIPDVVSFWANFNETDMSPVITAIPDTDTTDGCTAEHQLFANGINGSTVEHYRIINGGHTWPGSNFGGVGTNQDIDASREIWRFFSQFDINGSMVSAQHDIHLPTLSVYPNPTDRFVTIESGTSIATPYSLHTVNGQFLLHGNLHQATQVIDLGMLPSGMYILTIGANRLKIFKN